MFPLAAARCNTSWAGGETDLTVKWETMFYLVHPSSLTSPTLPNLLLPGTAERCEATKKKAARATFTWPQPVCSPENPGFHLHSFATNVFPFVSFPVDWLKSADTKNSALCLGYWPLFEGWRIYARGWMPDQKNAHNCSLICLISPPQST